LNVQNQDEQPHAVAVETRPSGVRTSWLDRWCAVRWRALITWIVLTGVMSLMLDFSEDWLFSQVQHATQSILQIGALPSRLEDAWQISLEVALVTWFHPVLLRVGLFRGAYWVMVFSAVCFARVLIDENSTTILVIASFLAAALPGLALIGVRTRPWMILPAAACFSAAASVLYEEEGHLLHLAASVPYPVILLYGTRLIRPATAAVIER
jgi:hypothetical protein